MEREQKQSEDVKARHIIILKSVYHHGVNVVVPEGISLEQPKSAVSNPHREMREVINDKCQHDQSAHHHVTRGERCFNIPLIYLRLISHTTGYNRQLDSFTTLHTYSSSSAHALRPSLVAVIANR